LLVAATGASCEVFLSVVPQSTMHTAAASYCNASLKSTVFSPATKQMQPVQRHARHPLTRGSYRNETSQVAKLATVDNGKKERETLFVVGQGTMDLCDESVPRSGRRVEQ